MVPALSPVMAGLVPAIHERGILICCVVWEAAPVLSTPVFMGGRDKPGHDGES